MRIVEVDRLRLFAVILAIYAHSALQQNFIDSYDSLYDIAMRSATRLGTPLLLVIFGIMGRLVYYEKLSHGDDVLPTLLIRALQCYFAFIALGFVGYILGYNSGAAMIAGLLLASPLQYANIFKMYMLLLFPVMIFLLKVRRKYGCISMVYVSIVIWIFDHFFLSDSVVPYSKLVHFFSFLIGYGDAFGPSVFHSIFLVAFGMLAADLMYVELTKKNLLCLSFVLFLCVSFFLFGINNFGVRDFFVRLADANYFRKSNSIFYYSYGVVFSFFLICFFKFATRYFSPVSHNFSSFFGSRTFSFYLIGNVVVLFTPAVDGSHTLKNIVVLFDVFLTFLLTWAWSRASKNIRAWIWFNAKLRSLSSLILRRMAR